MQHPVTSRPGYDVEKLPALHVNDLRRPHLPADSGPRAHERLVEPEIGDLRQCVPGRFNNHHAVMVGEIVAHVDYLTATIGRLDARVEEMMVPFWAARELLTTIPGIQQRGAEIILAEIGVDMTRFATPATSRPGPVSAPATTNPPASIAHPHQTR